MQIEVMSLRGSQWLQLFLEQAQIGQMVEHWCKESAARGISGADGGRARAPHPADGRHSSLQSIGRLPQIAVCHRLTVHKTVRPLAPCVPPRVRKPGQWCPE